MLALGIDGGGTKTNFLLADVTGKILAEDTAGGLDFKEIEYDGVVATVRRAVNGMLCRCNRQIEEIGAVCAGIPRMGEYPDWDKKSVALMGALFPNAKLHCVNDVQVGFYGSLFLQPGIHLVAGTGAIAIGQNQEGTWARSGGWSEYFSDEGSGYWLGLRSCELFAKQADYRLERSVLYSLWMEEFALDTPMDFISRFDSQYAVNRKKVAALQLLLEKAANQGDSSAQALYSSAAEELAMNVRAVCRQLHFAAPVPVSYSGGLFRSGKWLKEPLQKKLAELPVTWCEPEFSPVEGALLYALCRLFPGDKEQAGRMLRKYEDKKYSV